MTDWIYDDEAPVEFSYILVEVGLTDFLPVGLFQYLTRLGAPHLYATVRKNGYIIDAAAKRFNKIDSVWAESLLAFESLELLEMHQAYTVPDDESLEVYLH